MGVEEFCKDFLTQQFFPDTLLSINQGEKHEETDKSRKDVEKGNEENMDLF